MRSCGPLETIFADFTGALTAKVVLDSTKKTSGTFRKARGLLALLLGTFLLSQGWARASCSPLAIDVGYRTKLMVINEPKNCIKLWSIFAPALAGFLSVLQRSMGANGFLRSIGKKRVHVLSQAMAALILLPIAILQLASVTGQTQWQLIRSTWPLSSTVALGLVIAFFGDFYAEEKLLMPSHSFKAFQIVTCCICGLELLYGLDISLVGFLFCSSVLGLGVQELAFLPGQVSWEALGDTDYNASVYASWIKGPMQHVMSDSKSRKIAIFLLINTGFMVVEFFYGFLSNSLGLISDACHMLFDCAALAIGLYASYISRLPENSKFNYGYGRFEVVSGYANAVLLVLVASLIVLESLERILEPPEISTKSLLLVSVGGLLVNLVGLVFFHEEHHHAHGGGGSCSHSHLEDHKVPCAALHGTKVDHSVVTCDAPQLACQPHSHDRSDMLKVKIPPNFDNAGGYKTLCGDHKKDEKADCIDSVHASHSLAQQCTSANGLVSQEHHLHQHNLYDVQQHSHSHEQLVFSAVAPKHIHHECHDNDIGQHQHLDHVHFAHQDQGYQDHDGQHDISDDHSHHHHAHKHEHVDAENHDHGHGHGHDCHHDYHDHDNNQGHGHDCHHELHGHDHNQSHGHNCHHEHHGHDHHDHENDLHHNQDKSHGHGHHHHMDHNMYGIFLHVLADTLGSVGVVISTILIKYKGWLITDPACSIFLSALIIASVVPLLRNSGEILLQRTPRYNEDNLKAALKRISRIRGVKNSQRLHVWSFTSTNIVGSLHLQISAGSDKNLIRKIVSQVLRDAGIVDLTLQIEEI